MKKLPRRSPSHSPSLAWVAFALLFLALAGGIGGLYAHRQNQETTKKKLIIELEKEIAEAQDKTLALADEFEGRIAFAQLKLAVKEKNLPLASIAPTRREVITTAAGHAAPATAGTVIPVVHHP